MQKVQVIKSLRVLRVLAPALFLIVWCHTPGSARQTASSLRVTEGGICRNVRHLKCQDKGDRFDSDVGELTCWTRIVGAETPTSITHVWYCHTREVFRITLPVKSGNWRTYSKKKIPARDTGAWRVDVLGPQQEQLATFPFHVAPASGPKHAESRLSEPKAKPGNNIPSSPTKKPPKALGLKEKNPPETLLEQTVAPSRFIQSIGKDIRVEMSHAGSEKLLVNLDHYAQPRVIVLGGTRPSVAIHITGVSSWNGRSELKVNGKAIKTIRSNWYRGAETLRILLDMDTHILWKVKTYPESNERYCVEILYGPNTP